MSVEAASDEMNVCQFDVFDEDIFYAFWLLSHLNTLCASFVWLLATFTWTCPKIPAAGSRGRLMSV
jgi:hypothetical protein